MRPERGNERRTLLRLWSHQEERGRRERERKARSTAESRLRQPAMKLASTQTARQEDTTAHEPMRRTVCAACPTVPDDPSQKTLHTLCHTLEQHLRRAPFGCHITPTIDVAIVRLVAAQPCLFQTQGIQVRPRQYTPADAYFRRLTRQLRPAL